MDEILELANDDCDNNVVYKSVVGEIPDSLGEAFLHDLVGSTVGLVPFGPDIPALARKKRIIDDEDLSGRAKSTGLVTQGASQVLSTIPGIDVVDFLIPETTIWVALNKEEIDERMCVSSED